MNKEPLSAETSPCTCTTDAEIGLCEKPCPRDSKYRHLSSNQFNVAELRELGDCSPERCHDALMWAAGEIERLKFGQGIRSGKSPNETTQPTSKERALLESILEHEEHGLIEFANNGSTALLLAQIKVVCTSDETTKPQFDSLRNFAEWVLGAHECPGMVAHIIDNARGALEQASEKATPVRVQACRPEDRAMLQTEAGQELLQAATAAMRAEKAAEPSMVVCPRCENVHTPPVCSEKREKSMTYFHWNEGRERRLDPPECHRNSEHCEHGASWEEDCELCDAELNRHDHDIIIEETDDE